MINSTHHRSEEQIVADILATIFDGTKKKTRIMYGANLSYALTIKYLNRLQDCGLIQHDQKYSCFYLTQTGKCYLEEYSKYKTIEEQIFSQNSLCEEKRVILNQMIGKLVQAKKR